MADPKCASIPITVPMMVAMIGAALRMGKDHYLPREVKELGKRRCVLGNETAVECAEHYAKS